MKILSELEGVCLGIISKQQPCTAYKVRNDLKAAPSSHWQASAGSVYPLLARLEAAGLVAMSSDNSDGRGRKLLTVTPSGRKSLSKWVLAGADEALISSVSDPIRSRTFFLDALNAKQRRDCVDRMISELERFLQATESRLEEVPESEDLFGYLGSLGAMKVTAARLDWLRVVRERLTRT